MELKHCHMNISCLIVKPKQNKTVLLTTSVTLRQFSLIFGLIKMVFLYYKRCIKIFLKICFGLISDNLF